MKVQINVRFIHNYIVNEKVDKFMNYCKNHYMLTYFKINMIIKIELLYINANKNKKEGILVAGTVWALIPPCIAILIALLTREVYLALIVSVLGGTLLFTGFNYFSAADLMFRIMTVSIGENAYLLVFLVLLGIFVASINKSGASQAYGEWASKAIKGRRTAMFLTMLLGIIIFIDDYFNCLTVGTVMRPVTDKFHITRAKLAYVIDATAAPVCIIAPVSSWAAAVASSIPEDSAIDGFALFLNAIPFNYYAWFTILFMLFMIYEDQDFSEMKRYEINHAGKLEIQEKDVSDGAGVPVGNGKICDLIIPLFILIACCIFGMLYTGGILEGAGIKEAFTQCDSMRGLSLGAFTSLLFTFIFYIVRKTLSVRDFCASFVEGFKAMVPATLILVLAWSLSGICSHEYLNLGGYIGDVVRTHMAALIFIPCLFFLASLGLCFSTGTSWGTFGILIPIALAVVGEVDVNFLTITVSAILAGAVAGDHVSPISDTTIMASAGAQCNHLDHVKTQLPYAALIMFCSFAGYLVSGITANGWFGCGAGLITLLACMIYLARVTFPSYRKNR